MAFRAVVARELCSHEISTTARNAISKISEATMGKVILGMTMSLDGFINDRDGSVSRLYPDFEALHETELLQEAMRNTGAVVMGKHAYDMANGDFTGYEFQTPIFVLTHHVPEKVAKGENEKLKFTFVTDGIASAIEKAKAAAGDQDVQVIGGADAFRQSLQLGLVDELQLGIVPVLLGEGLRLFEHLDTDQIQLTQVRVIESPGRTDLVFNVVKS
jgi:dihydrofolate reductase